MKLSQKFPHRYHLFDSLPSNKNARRGICG